VPIPNATDFLLRLRRYINHLLTYYNDNTDDDNDDYDDGEDDNGDDDDR